MAGKSSGHPLGRMVALGSVSHASSWPFEYRDRLSCKGPKPQLGVSWFKKPRFISFDLRILKSSLVYNAMKALMAMLWPNDYDQ
jgi:hypothetical protein